MNNLDPEFGPITASMKIAGLNKYVRDLVRDEFDKLNAAPAHFKTCEVSYKLTDMSLPLRCTVPLSFGDFNHPGKHHFEFEVNNE